MWRSIQFLSYGWSRFTLNGYETMRKAKNFVDIDTPSDLMKDKTVMVTGANAGLGLATAKWMRRQGANVEMVCRNAERGEAARAIVESEPGGGRVRLLLCDVSRPREIARLVSELGENYSLDCLVNNAGIMLTPYEEKRQTDDGIESHVATNVLGGFILTELLLPVLQRSKGRVIHVASGGGLTEDLRIGEDYESSGGRRWSNRDAYAMNKRSQIALTEYYAEKEEAEGGHVKHVSMHPGWSDTAAVKQAMPDFYEKLKSRLRTPEQGADTINYLASCDAAQLRSGEFYRDRAVERKHLSLTWGTEHTPEKKLALVEWLKALSKQGGVEL